MNRDKVEQYTPKCNMVYTAPNFIESTSENDKKCDKFGTVDT